MGRLEGKVAIVVGGGQTPGETVGNGRATCLRFAQERARVVVVDRSIDSAEETVDLITKEAIVWNEVDQGMTYEVIDIPDELKDTVDEWRQNLVESVAEYDDNLLEKFFDDPDSITKEEMMAAIRKAVIDMSFSPGNVWVCI